MVLYFTQWSSDCNTHVEMENPGLGPILADGSSKQTSLAFLIKPPTNKVVGKGLPRVKQHKQWDLGSQFWIYVSIFYFSTKLGNEFLH